MAGSEKKTTDKERFESKVELIPFHSCHEWTGFKEKNGYGRFGMGYGKRKWRMLWAHRVIYEMNIGKIPKGLTIDHLCNNVGCVNTDHFEVVTRSENCRRAWARKRLKNEENFCG